MKGIRTRRSRNLHPCDVTTYRGVPVTTVPRTLVDLAAVLEAGELARAAHEAGVRFRTTPDRVEEVIGRLRSPPGAGDLRRVLHGDVRVTLSKLERRFLEVLGEACLPLPLTNRPAGGRFVDCRWPEHRLTVELDSYRFHRSRHAWEQDRRREREAFARGDQIRRFTHDDVMVTPAPMVAELSHLLSPARR